jgi:hypothetical protein
MTHSLSLAVLSWDDIWPTVGEAGISNENVPVRFRILPRGANWEVFRGKAFWGIFHSRSDANDTVRAAMIEIFALGGAAQVRFT